MNPKRLILAIVAVFATIFATDFLIHGVWLKSDYAATMSLWRPEAEMQAHTGWLVLGQFLCTVTFVVLWAKGFAGSHGLRCACLFGLCMGLFSQAATLISYAVQPLPGELVMKWFAAGLLQALLAGIVSYLVYKPKPPIVAS